MTDSIKDRAREGQMAALGGLGDEAMETELLAMAEGLYTSVDALTAEQKTLLVREALMKASALVEVIGSAPSAGVRGGYCAVAHAVIALAGYAIEEFREGQGYTVTGDKKVTEALDGVKTLLGKFSEAKMSPEQRALAEKVNASIKRRVQSGEEYESALNAALHEHEAERRALEDVPAAKSQGREARPDDGMYL